MPGTRSLANYLGLVRTQILKESLLDQNNFQLHSKPYPYTHSSVQLLPLIEEASLCSRDHYRQSQLIIIQRSTDCEEPSPNICIYNTTPTPKVQHLQTMLLSRNSHSHCDQRPKEQGEPLIFMLRFKEVCTAIQQCKLSTGYANQPMLGMWLGS